MGQPRMTEEQRIVAVTLLANAIRRDAHHQARLAGRDDAVPFVTVTHRQAAASAQYVRGMRDLLAVLFAGGRAEADACYEVAWLMAGGDARPAEEPPDSAR